MAAVRAPRPSRTTSRANAVCASTTRAIRNVAPAGASGGVSLHSLGRYLDTVTPIVDSEVKQLRALPRPVADRKLLERYLAAEYGLSACAGGAGTVAPP